MEQPTRITTKPLSPGSQEDRIRKVFGLTSDDLVPEVNDSSLHAYYKSLSKSLVFPFAAKCRVGYGRPQQGQVIGLFPLEDEVEIDESYGLFCATSLNRLSPDERGRNNWQLRDWLKRFYQSRKNWKSLLELLVEEFRREPSLSQYQRSGSSPRS